MFELWVPKLPVVSSRGVTDCRPSLFDQHFSLIGIINKLETSPDNSSGMYFVLGRNRVCQDEGRWGASVCDYKHPPECLHTHSSQKCTRPRHFCQMGAVRRITKVTNNLTLAHHTTPRLMYKLSPPIQNPTKKKACWYGGCDLGRLLRPEKARSRVAV